MAAARSKVPLGRRLRHGLRTYRAWVSDFVLAVGVALTVLAVGFFTPLANVGPFPAINSATNAPGANYNLLFVVIGPIIVIVGAYMVGSYYVARHKFEHLMVTKSKAEFLRNIPELETLLWDLTPQDEVRYEQKRSELRVRR
ncbi:MAG TPA: DUF3198 domain-containing protein [Thermoplasmata archaeon]|jgi:hypothetical protein|nr:DUF3198 domain-containing protein [Thermoplasmata archaeon]